MIRHRIGTLAVPFILWATAAAGGVVDSALPMLQTGVATKHVFTVPGVIKNNNLETEFVCTSMDAVNTIRVAVEIFAAAGGPPLNDVTEGVGDGAQDVGPGATVTIGTGNTLGVHEDEVISATALPPASVKNGSARILSTSSRIVCSAFVLDDTSDPPASTIALTIVKSKTQKGD